MASRAEGRRTVPQIFIDVKSVFAGLRPLVSVNDPNIKSKEISRIIYLL